METIEVQFYTPGVARWDDMYDVLKKANSCF